MREVTQHVGSEGKGGGRGRVKEDRRRAEIKVKKAK